LIIMAKQKAEKKEDGKGPQEKIEELTHDLQRVQADFENYRKRMEREREEYAKMANRGMVARLLPVLDNFQLALLHKQHEEFIKAVEMVYAEMYAILEDAGLKQMDALGKPFDPYVHEALLQEESGQEQGTVLEELQKGYLFQGQVLRHAKVKIAKKRSNGDQEKHAAARDPGDSQAMQESG